MSFGYNANYTLDYKLDSKGQKISYVYDDFKRVTQVKRYLANGTESQCERVTYTYGDDPAWTPVPGYGDYALGKVAQMVWGNGGFSSCETTQGGMWTESYSYSQAGQMTIKRLQKTGSTSGCLALRIPTMMKGRW